ncbi:hypothetical protein CAEBREN_16556 [Caenorhabditis brenneri]|uniref:Uncharacterized protein n=1 Tax=Caenorhabditis brenneri TaxID=135651 RepID=G0P1K8_CAEBE|nr:hypothetical protein CAEBREN_16556 [Caenorhabditis brenneri]
MKGLFAPGVHHERAIFVGKIEEAEEATENRMPGTGGGTLAQVAEEVQAPDLPTYDEVEEEELPSYDEAIEKQENQRENDVKPTMNIFLYSTNILFIFLFSYDLLALWVYPYLIFLKFFSAEGGLHQCHKNPVQRSRRDKHGTF